MNAFVLQAFRSNKHICLVSGSFVFYAMDHKMVKLFFKNETKTKRNANIILAHTVSAFFTYYTAVKQVGSTICALLKHHGYVCTSHLLFLWVIATQYIPTTRFTYQMPFHVNVTAVNRKIEFLHTYVMYSCRQLYDPTCMYRSLEQWRHEMQQYCRTVGKTFCWQ